MFKFTEIRAKVNTAEIPCLNCCYCQCNAALVNNHGIFVLVCDHIDTKHASLTEIDYSADIKTWCPLHMD